MSAMTSGSGSIQHKLKMMIAVVLGALSVAIVWAASYYFHISAAGAAYATSTFASDSAAAFDGANRVARSYLYYTNPIAIFKGIRDDWIYISYHDGKIGKFKVVSATDTVRLRFDGLVSGVPADVRRPALFPMTSVFERMDYYIWYMLDFYNSWFFEREHLPVGSVTIIQYNEGLVSGGGCGGAKENDYGCPILNRMTSD